MKKKLLVAIPLLLAVAVALVFVRRRALGRAAELAAAAASASAASTDARAFRSSRTLKVAEIIYDGKLFPQWEDWGWGQHKLGTGPAQIVFGEFGGITFHHDELPARFGGLSFRFASPDKRRDFLSVTLKRASGSESPRVEVGERHIAPLEQGWSEVYIDWAELDPAHQPFDRIVISASGPVGNDWVLLDKVVLTAQGAVADSALRNDALSVLCDGAAHAIDPLIYGSSSDDWSDGHTAHRIGGNTMTRNNWELGAWNTGSDWFFRNVSGEGNVFDWVDAAAKQGHQTALVVPTIGWVAKDGKSVGFPRSKFGPQRKYDPNFAEAGDGYGQDGEPLTPGAPTQTSVPAPPELIGRWISKLVAADKARGTRSVQMYILDNEPTLWNKTHRDVHPDALSYSELLDRTLRYGAAIRDADPDAIIAGPAAWGWTGYMYSAVDREAGWALRPDRRLHGDLPLLTWYLQQLSQQEKASGKRILDVLDVHFYPTPEGIFGPNPRTDPEASELRLRSTRALWDPTYKEESWVNDVVRLIPRLREWVAANYPGRKVSIGEWSFGAEEHISGGLATAEALGRFGQQQLDAAFYWGKPPQDSPTFWAFRAYRNFDGHGGRFLDKSLPTRETDRVSLFASRDESGQHLVLVLVNRDPARRSDANIRLQGCAALKTSRMFTFEAGSHQLSESEGVTRTNDGVKAKLAPYSFTVLDLGLAP